MWRRSPDGHRIIIYGCLGDKETLYHTSRTAVPLPRPSYGPTNLRHLTLRIVVYSFEMVDITIRKRPRTEAVITQRKFFKKTARGKVIKGKFSVGPHTPYLTALPVLRERYLRDDVGCGINGCSLCHALREFNLPSDGASHVNFPNGHFILPDTNVFLAQVCAILSCLADR